MKWLITGGCGFIGANLIGTLMREGGHRVRVLDDLSVGTRAAIERHGDVVDADADTSGAWPEAIELRRGDIRAPEPVRAAAEGADAIVHLAANTGVEPSLNDPRADCETNVLGTLNVLEAARAAGDPRVVFASSGAPLGHVEPPIHEEIAPHPASPYGASKLAGEGYCSAYFHSFGVETVVLRFGNVYGPLSGHKGSVVARFFKDAYAGRPLEIHGDGSQTRDFIFIDDLVKAIRLAAVRAGIGGEAFQIATNSECTIHALADAVIDVLRKNGEPVPTVTHGTPRRGDVARNYSDIRKARDVLGWQPDHTLRDGLIKTQADFAARQESE